jgi:hypothetical protein
MSCKILIQIKKAGEETSIKDYFKYSNNNTQEIKYKDLLTYFCDSVITTYRYIYVEKDGKKIKAFDLHQPSSQPYF